VICATAVLYPSSVAVTVYVAGVDRPSMSHRPWLPATVEVVAENVSVPSVTTRSTPPNPPFGPVTIPPRAPAAGCSSTSSSTGLPSSGGVTWKDWRSNPGFEKLIS
jgi:hypothetical protein